ncbi:hypothetical protein GF374_02805 [Candidatus Woesearchaeota archaeon]|nr:hypothetical protein [Candidatus Woesearchaeota archaeon]
MIAKSKKGLGMVSIIFIILLALIIFVVLVFLGTGLVESAGGKLKAISGLGEEEIDVGGTQYQSEACASSWECQKNLACVDNECQPSVTTDPAFVIYAKLNCHNSYSKFLEKKDEKGDCKSFVAGNYYLEASSDKSKPIDKKGETGPSYSKFYVYAEAGPTPTQLEDYGFELVQEKQPEEGKKNIYNMNMNTIYKANFDSEWRFCGWVQDSNCDDNSGKIAIRIDEIKK